MIKKILLGMTLLMSMVSCTEDFTDWANPQTNPQEDAVAFGDGSVAPVDLIDFAKITDDQTEVKVCNITAPSASNEAYNPQYKLNLGDKSYDITESGVMSLADFKDYVVSTYGKAPVERDIDATVSMWENNGTSAIKLKSGVFQIKTKLTAPEIANAYYIVGARSSPTARPMFMMTQYSPSQFLPRKAKIPGLPSVAKRLATPSPTTMTGANCSEPRWVMVRTASM